MLSLSAVFILGLGILYLGADWLVQGASAVAKRFGIRPLIVGLTVVAMGTSIPEFLLNFFAVMAGEDGLAIGNIIGSNISNIALILGVSAVLLPLAFDGNVLRKEYPMMLAVTGLFYILSLDGVLSRVDGIILLSSLVAFMVFIVNDALKHAKNSSLERESVQDEEVDPAANAFTRFVSQSHIAPYFRVLLIIAGIAALAIGARLMVDSAVGIAELLQIAPIIIGLTIVAIGTSLPELAASLMSAFRNENDMAVGNVVGSNILNILFVIGFVAVIRPMEVEVETLQLHFPVLIGFSLLLYPLARTKHALSRIDGILLLIAFVVYLVWLIYPELT